MSQQKDILVFCKDCRQKDIDDCIYPARNVSFVETKDVIYIRTGFHANCCSYCGEFENFSYNDHFCYSCNHELQLSTKVVCHECNNIAIEIPTIQQKEYSIESDDNNNNNEIINDISFECPVGIACTDTLWTITLPCQHTCCLECFCYVMQNDACTMNDIIYDSNKKCNFVRCFECDQLISEEYLRLGGKQAWEMYKDRIIDLGNKENICRCPLPNCGGINTGLKSVQDQQIIKCGFCNRYICRHCNEEAIRGRCPSKQQVDIQKTLRCCPNCGIPVTHYFGHGCHHIGIDGGCPGCRAKGQIYHWCYYCLKGGDEYPETCKKEHWFCKLSGCDICPPCPICNKGNDGNYKPCVCK